MVDGYFKFELKEDGLYLNLYAPKDGGNNVKIEDVVYAMDKRKLPNTDLVPIKAAIAEGVSKALKVGPTGIYSTDGFMDLKVSGDGMIAVAKFFPPFVGGNDISKKEILSDLAFSKVTYGINEEIIDQFVQNPVYLTSQVIAVGTKVVEGKDAELKYNFDLDKKPLPKVREDGSVDFYDLDSINHVSVGDVVAEIIKEVHGKSGFDVYGKEIKPKNVKRVIFRYGRGLKVSEDGLKLISEINGHVDVFGDRITVSDTFEVAGDVSYATGNIDYDGNVLVKGNVLSGFSIKATGDIEVRGIVEGAILRAAGNVILSRGIQGALQGEIYAGKCVVAKFIENTKLVCAGEKIESGTILHSKVECDGEVIVEGKNGLIAGGSIYAMYGITTKNLGNEMGTSTEIVLGANAAMKNRQEEIKKEIAKLSESKDKLSQVILLLYKKNNEGEMTPDKIMLLKKTKANFDEVQKQLSELEQENEAILAKITDAQRATLKVVGTIYPGCKVEINNSDYKIKEPVKYAQFKKLDGDVRMLSL